MSRNLTKSIMKLVEKLKNVLPSANNYTIDGDSTAVHWGINLKITNHIRLFPDFYSAWISYENQNYLALVNYSLSTIPNFLQEENLNAGAWVAIIDELDIAIKKNADLSIVEEILDQEWGKTPDGKFYQIVFDQEINGKSLKDFFPISLYKITTQFVDKEQLNQITGLLFSTEKTNYLLPFSDDIFKEFNTLFAKGNKKIPFENVLSAYVASDYKFAYLDLYRCVEYLQTPFYLKDFYEKLNLSHKTLIEFCIDFHNSTGLEPKLDTSLEKLFKTVSAEDSRKYYKTRNQIVHFRPTNSNSNLPQNVADWNKMILDMLKIIQKLYDQHHSLV